MFLTDYTNKDVVEDFPIVNFLNLCYEKYLLRTEDNIKDYVILVNLYYENLKHLTVFILTAVETILSFLNEK